MFVTFGDALMLLFKLADKEDKRFQPAAARWHALFTLEAQLPLRESEMLMNLLCGIRGANRQHRPATPPRSSRARRALESRHHDPRREPDGRAETVTVFAAITKWPPAGNPGNRQATITEGQSPR